MTDHLPECWVIDCLPDDCPGCAALRACEARVRASEFPLGVAVGKHDGFLEGYAAALDAARDAVIAVPFGPRVISRSDALAAIDALKEKP